MDLVSTRTEGYFHGFLAQKRSAGLVSLGLMPHTKAAFFLVTFCVFVKNSKLPGDESDQSEMLLMQLVLVAGLLSNYQLK